MEVEVRMEKRWDLDLIRVCHCIWREKTFESKAEELGTKFGGFLFRLHFTGSHKYL